MSRLTRGLVLFVGTHSVGSGADDWRGARIARLGLMPWKGIVSVISIIGFVLIVWGYGEARSNPIVLYSPPVWTRHIAALLTVPAFILLVAAYIPGTRIKRAVGHPMVAAVKIWAFAHLLANGTLADVVLFGAFLAWAVADYIAARRRDRAAGTVFTVGPVSRDIAAVIIGLAAWAAFAFWLHAAWIGVRPFG